MLPVRSDLTLAYRLTAILAVLLIASSLLGLVFGALVVDVGVLVAVDWYHGVPSDLPA